MSADATTTTSDRLAQLQPGERLAGCYLLEKRVEGTAQPLWLAQDEVLGKKIALHFLPLGALARSGVGDRLRQEVKRARQFVNQRVVRVQELIEEDEWAAIAMDAFAGRPLSAVVAANTHGFFEVAEVQPLVRELCELFTAAHQINLAHGNLALENILVGEGQAKLMEFGVGAALREDGATLPLASAQQLAGAAATPADDIFSIGALLHTVLAGAPPFEGSERKNAPSIAEHRRQLNHRGGDVPEVWERTIASCLAEDPSARPTSCEEIVRLLEVSGAPAPAPAAAPTAVPVPVEAKPVVEEAPAAAAIVPPAPAPEKTPEIAPEPAPIEEPKPAAAETKPIADEPKLVIEEVKPPVAETKPAVEEVKKPAAEESKPAATESKPAAETKPAVEEAKSQEKKPAAEEKKPVTLQKPASSPERMDPAEIAARVRREEAEEEGRRRRLVDDEEDAFYDRPHGSGPSLVSMLIIVGAVALVVFLVYKYFFAEPSTSPTSATATITEVNLSTPAPLATPEPATPAPATPEPSTPMPVAKTTPEPVPATPPPAEQPEVRTTTTTPTDDPQKIEAAIAEIKTAREKATKDLPAVKKAVSDLDTQQKKLVDDLTKAEKAAEEAEKLALERKKAADDARKAAMTAAEQLEAKKLDVVKAEEAVTRFDLDLKDKERVLIEAKANAEAAKQRAKMTANATPAPIPGATPMPSATLRATPAPAPTPVSPTPDDPRAAFEQKMKELSKVLDGAPGAKAATPAPTTPTVTTAAPPVTTTPTATPAMELAKATTPAPAPVVSVAKAGSDGLLNSLGMKLVPLQGADVLMCIWPTRVRDFESFALATKLKSNLWKDPGFKQTVDHPVVNVTWQEADAFCKWLTAKERKEGVISATQSYRLPTDIEWSQGAGLGPEKGNTPEARDMSVPEVYPWGKAWPPPQGAGNYTGEETNSDVAIKGYNDGFAWTSPVGSFPPNKLGLFDMGGNVWQWCMDSWSPESKSKVLRGASWYNGALKLSLLTSCRIHASPDSSTDNYGFRVVLTGGGR